MKFYKYTLMMFLFLSSCQPSSTQDTPFVATETPTPVSDEVPPVYEIPEWLRNPATNVLMYTRWTKNPKDLDANPQATTVLLDPLTGEKFSLKLEDAQLYEWIDNRTIGLSPLQNLECQSEISYSHILDVSSGSLTTNDFGSHFCAADEPEEVWVSTYSGSVEYYNGNERVEFIPFSSELDNRYGNLSPDGTVIIIIQSDLASGELNRIGIYDFSQKKKPAILYAKNISQSFLFIGHEHKIIYFEENTPCILNWDDLQKECGMPLPDEYHDPYPEYINEDVIGFNYGGAYNVDGGRRLFCLYNMSTGQLSCPMNDLEIFKPFKFTWETVSGSEVRIRAKSAYEKLISPDEKFIYFTYGDPPQFVDSTQQAVVSMDGRVFLDLGLLSMDIFYSSPIDPQWRPLP